MLYFSSFVHRNILLAHMIEQQLRHWPLHRPGGVPSPHPPARHQIRDVHGPWGVAEGPQWLVEIALDVQPPEAAAEEEVLAESSKE